MTHTKRCFIIFIFANFLINFPSLSSETYVVLDSLVGKAEVQKAGFHVWKAATVGTKLYNNDIIRVLDSSLARLKLSNDNTIYVYQNSQLLINLFDNKQTGMMSRHISIFFGAAFFVLRTILPQQTSAETDVKVYTPTTVVAIRGTSFEINVEPKSGSTDIKVISGTVLVRNILKNVYSYVSAGYKTTVALNNDPVSPGAVLTPEIETLKMWVPPKVVAEEMEKQLASSKLAPKAMSAKYEKNKILIGLLYNESSDSIYLKLARLLPSALGQQLKKEKIHLPVELTDSLNHQNVFSFGASKKARYGIIVTLRDFSIFKIAKINTSATNYYENVVAKIHITFQLIDLVGKKLLMEEEIKTEASTENISDNLLEKTTFLSFDMTDPKFTNSIVGSVLRDAIERITQKLSTGLLLGISDK